jgi:hypothetical protein
VENSRVQGGWTAGGAALLGLGATVTREASLPLCENRHPASGAIRMNRVGSGESANRLEPFEMFK